MSELRGCTDGNCIIRKPEGMHTNGGCGCERELRHALGLQDSRRFIHALRERQREVAALLEEINRLRAKLLFAADVFEVEGFPKLAETTRSEAHAQERGQDERSVEGHNQECSKP